MSTNIGQRSIRMIIAMANIFGFWIWAKDMSQAYLQSARRLTRNVYVKPKEGFKLKSSKFSKLFKPLFGLPDSRDRWHITMENHVINNLRIHPLTGNLAYFSKCVLVELSGRWIHMLTI